MTPLEAVHLIISILELMGVYYLCFMDTVLFFKASKKKRKKYTRRKPNLRVISNG